MADGAVADGAVADGAPPRSVGRARAAPAPSCPICCEKYSIVVRSPITCGYCQAEACKKCVERYLLGTSEDSHCMSCRRPWSLEFLDTVLTRSFNTGPLKAHREQVLFDRENSMMPGTQPAVRAVIDSREISTRLRELEHARDQLTAQISELGARRIRLARGIADGTHGANAADCDRRQFIKPCVVNGCRGFLSTAYKCGMCSVRVCPDCHEVRRPDEEHVCDPGTVESVRAISRDSRPCPRCGSMIFRISGCSQMYCTAPGCKTAFDWNTGRVVTGRIHNPHYYEFMHRRRDQHEDNVVGRELDDIPCGGMPTPHEMFSALKRAGWNLVNMRVPPPERLKTLLDAHRMVIHVQELEMVLRYPAVDPPDFNTNKDLRVKYMLNELTLDDLKRQLQAREKRRNKLTAINQVLATLTNVSSDLFRALISVLNCSEQGVEATMTQMEELRDYTNTSMMQLGRRFGCVVPMVASNWLVVRKGNL